MSRPDKINYYLDIAETVSKRSTCLRKHYGAIIVKNDIIISTGYNGAPGRKNCSDMGYCKRDELGIPRGERYEMCRSVHAEANAIMRPTATRCSVPRCIWRVRTRKRAKSSAVSAPA